MEFREKPHTDKYKRIMNDFNYVASCTPTSPPEWDLLLEYFDRLIFVVQGVPPEDRMRWKPVVQYGTCKSVFLITVVGRLFINVILLQFRALPKCTVLSFRLTFKICSWHVRARSMNVLLPVSTLPFCLHSLATKQFVDYIIVSRYAEHLM
jgi:hypothetical protein